MLSHSCYLCKTLHQAAEGPGGTQMGLRSQMMDIWDICPCWTSLEDTEAHCGGAGLDRLSKVGSSSLLLWVLVFITTPWYFSFFDDFVNARALCDVYWGTTWGPAQPQNQRLVGVLRALKNHPIPVPCCGQGYSFHSTRVLQAPSSQFSSEGPKDPKQSQGQQTNRAFPILISILHLKSITILSWWYFSPQALVKQK